MDRSAPEPNSSVGGRHGDPSGPGRSRRRRRRAVLTGLLGAVAAVAVAVAAWGGVREPDDGTSADGRPGVGATTNFVADTVREIGGDRVRVVSLMGPGVDPHLYRATAGDLERLRGADLVVTSGLQLEAKLGDVLRELGDETPVVPIAEGVEPERLLDPPGGAPEGEEHDPHVWFDVAMWRRAAGQVATALPVADPAGTAGYRERAARFDAELRDLDTEVRGLMAGIAPQRRVLVTSHDAFRYLGRAYDLDVEGIQGISTSAEATSADVDRIAEVIARRDVPSIFVESSVPRQTIDAVRQAARRRGADVEVGGELYADAAGDAGTEEGTYVGMVRANARTIAAGLGGQR